MHEEIERRRTESIDSVAVASSVRGHEMSGDARADAAVRGAWARTAWRAMPAREAPRGWSRGRTR